MLFIVLIVFLMKILRIVER